jgi:hypothetical protein
MTTNSQTVDASAQFAQLFKRVKQLSVREQLELVRMVLESVLNAKSEGEEGEAAGFSEATAGAWVGEPLVRESQGDYETRVALQGRAFAEEVITLSELTQHPIEQTLREVAKGHHPLTVRLPNGVEIIIQLKPALKILPTLEGYVPQDWKEAIYDDAA